MVDVGALIAVFAVTILLMNLLLHFVIDQADPAGCRRSPVSQPRQHGRAGIRAERGRDEIASLAGSFNRMRRSLANAMKLLES